MNKKKLRGSLALTFATVIWGSAFIAQSVGMDYVGPFTFQTMRSVLAVPFLILVVFAFERSPRETMRKWFHPELWKAGLPCGIALFVAAGLQQMGIVHTSAGKAGFITAMYIVLVPILGIFLKKKPPFTAWISVGLAVAGLYLLSCVGVTQVNIGDLYLLGCALGYAVQITLVDQMAVELDGLRLNCVQSLICGICSGVVMFITEEPILGNILACWVPLVYAGIFSLGIAFSLQIIGQKYVDPTPASLIMSLESVFAVLFGWLLLNERMSVYEISGCVLVFGAVIISQIPIKKSHD
jgi:drug/metabolite transporter (DMT)-like permease